MSLYAIKNDRDEWYDWYDCEFWPKDACAFIAIGNHEDAERIATEKGAHVVELVEKPAPEVVSEDEAEMLKRAKVAAFPAHIFDSGAPGSLPGSQDRLMRAYVIGWVVAKPKRWNIKVPHMASYWYTKCGNNELAPANALVTDYVQFTDAEIEHYGLQDCEKEEVTDDGEARDED